MEIILTEKAKEKKATLRDALGISEEREVILMNGVKAIAITTAKTEEEVSKYTLSAKMKAIAELCGSNEEAIFCIFQFGVNFGANIAMRKAPRILHVGSAEELQKVLNLNLEKGGE